MKYLEHYSELLTMIDVYNELKLVYETAIYSAKRILNKASGDISAISYDGMPGAKYPSAPTEITLQNILNNKYNLEEVEETLKVLNKSKEEIENFISSLEGNKNKVAYLKFIKNMKTEYIAITLNLSIGRVNNLISEIKRESKLFKNVKMA